MTSACRSTVALVALWYFIPSNGQSEPQGKERSAPIYSVTVVSRTLSAVNYQHRGGPTKINFKGTVLLPTALGEAIIESKSGRIEINCKLDHLEAPDRFGGEYLTYVLWAITPEGRALNLGEVVPNASNKGELHVTTDLQVFGLIVTAEPYFSIRHPSDVVVLENEIRPDTVGKVEQVNAKYELMPRGQYTYQVQGTGRPLADASRPRVSMDQYEALVELYQAQNAVQIARSVGADRYAASAFNKALQLLQQAGELQKGKGNMKAVVTAARAAAQTAEDSREIAVKRHEEEDARGQK